MCFAISTVYSHQNMEMKEDFLHYIWNHKKFDLQNLRTDTDLPIHLISVGQANLNSGPDFFNVLIEIGDQKWAGNVEIHLRSSDWYTHGHETDPRYDNVILHVVWENDAQVYRRDHSTIPTLVLKDLVSADLIGRYEQLLNSTKHFINCEKDFSEVEEFVKLHWLERLYFERLDRKTSNISALLKHTAQDWEAVLYGMLFKYFGVKENEEAFENLYRSIDYSIVRKNSTTLLSLEALFFGQAGFLELDCEDAYFLSLKKEYDYLSHKYQLPPNLCSKPQFFRLRPPNFPTIRLSQLAQLFSTHSQLFDKITAVKTIEEYYQLFGVDASDYWNTHYTFGKSSKNFKKKITKSFIDLLVINVIIPIRFAHLQSIGKHENDLLLQLIQSIDPEHNSITKNFDSLQKINTNALTSQALIQLKNEYCTPNSCLRCEIGAYLLKK